MQNEYAAPVDHGVLSATGAVAAGTVGGGLKSGFKTALWTIGGFATVGLLIGTGILPGLLALGGATAGVWPVIGYTLGGAALGAALSPFTGTLGAMFGAGKGALNAAQRVSDEKGASQAMQAQVAVYQAQAMAASNDNKYNFPPQGSAMNPAGTTIGSIQRDGVMAGQQLQRA